MPKTGARSEELSTGWTLTAVDAEVRLYSTLFTDPDPEADDKDFMECLNPNSLEILTGCKSSGGWRTRSSGAVPVHEAGVFLRGQLGFKTRKAGVQPLGFIKRQLQF